MSRPTTRKLSAVTKDSLDQRVAVAATSSAPASATSHSAQRLVVPLDSLVPFPDQELYDPRSEAEDLALCEDIRVRGLQVPIEGVPEKCLKQTIYRILDGMRRLSALNALGYSHVEILVRHDLANVPEAERRLAFLSANLMRRQLGTMERVRIGIRIIELQMNEGRPLSHGDLAKAREKIGRLIGLTGRSVAHYLRLSRAPLPVQRLVSQEWVQLVVAEKVASLPPEAQAKIAARLAAVRDAKEARAVISEYVTPRVARLNPGMTAYCDLIRLLKRVLPDLEPSAGRLGPLAVRKDRVIIESAYEVLGLLRKAARRKSAFDEMKMLEGLDPNGKDEV